MEWESQDRHCHIVFTTQLGFKHNFSHTTHQLSSFEMAFPPFFLVNSYSSLKTQLKLYLICELSLAPPRWRSIPSFELLRFHP